jgi:hypothetical protein
MNFRNNLLIALSAAALPAAAQVQDPLCKLNHHQPRYISWLPEFPSYFAKVHPEGKFAFFIGSGNRLVNLEETDESKRIQTVPGSIDPVPCPDGKLLTVPGMSLYEISTVLKDGENAEALLTDSTHEGVYQSCAVLSKSGSSTVYRVITDASGEVAFRDYKVTYSSSHAARVTPQGDAKLRCPKMNLKTIIVSKTGKYLSAYLPDVGTTKIFDIEGRSGACKEVADIGYATGKLEFNFDDTRVAFHVDYFSSQAGDYFSGVSNDMSKDVFTLDIARQSNGKLKLSNLRRLTTARLKGSGSYYPSFAKSGEILFLSDEDNFYSFHAVNPERIPAYAPVLPPPEGWPGGTVPDGVPADWNQRLHAASVMGSLWSKRCSEDDEEVSAVEAASVKMVMPTSTCLELVKEYWKPGYGEELSKHVRFSRDKRFDASLVSQFTAGQLNESCRDNPEVNDPPPVEYGRKLSGQLDGPRLIQHYCVGCHVSGGALRLPDGTNIPNMLNFRALTEDQIQMALMRVDLPAGEGRMPPRGFEPPAKGVDHKQIVKDYLNCRLKQFTLPKDQRPYCD